MLWPLAGVLGGLAAYFLVFANLVDPLNPSPVPPDPSTYQFLWEVPKPPDKAVVLAADLNARYAIGIPSVLMTLSFLATLIFAFAMILPAMGRAAIACGAVSLPIGAAIGFYEQYNNPLRMSVTNCPPGTASPVCPLDQAVLRAGDGGTFDTAALDQILFLTNWNSMLSVAGIFLLAMCFLFLARTADEDQLDPAQLRSRLSKMGTAMMLGALVLIFSVATADGFYHLAPALMAETDAEPFASLALAGATYWGAVYTTVMIVISAPAAISIQHDIARATDIQMPGSSMKDRREWRLAHGLAMNTRESVGPMFAALAPVVTAPVLNAVRPVLIGE